MIHHAIRARRHGITRSEVMVLLVLFVVGAGLVLTYLFRNRGRAAHLACAENLRRIGVGIYERQGVKFKSLEAVEEVLHGKDIALPAARIAEGYGTWAVQLGMFLRSDTPLARWDLGVPFTRQPAEVRESVAPLFLCPARSRTSFIFAHEENGTRMSGAVGDYACASGDGDPKHPWTGPEANGAIIEGEVLERDDKGRIAMWRSRTGTRDLEEKKGRGLAQTILIGEKHVPLAELGTLEGGDGSIYDGRHPSTFARVGGPGFGLASGLTAPFNYNFGSYHVGFSQFLYADVSVRPMALEVSETVLGRLISREP